MGVSVLCVIATVVSRFTWTESDTSHVSKRTEWLEGQLKDTRKTIEMLEGKCDANTGEIRTVREIMTRSERDYSVLVGKVDELVRSVSEMTGTIRAQTAQLTALQGRIDDSIYRRGPH